MYDDSKTESRRATPRRIPPSPRGRQRRGTSSIAAGRRGGFAGRRGPGVVRSLVFAALAGTSLAACSAAPHCPDPQTPAVQPGGMGPRATLEQFVLAAEARDFQTAWLLLSGPQRARYTPERLEADFDAVAGRAEEKLARARAALAGEPRIDGSRAEFVIGGDRAVRLVHEEGGWRVESLE